MEFSLDSYRMLARVAGIAHKTKDTATATDAFRTLWSRLDRETPDDHSDARQAFNDAFARAYRGQEVAPTATAALYDYLHPKIKSERTAPTPSAAWLAGANGQGNMHQSFSGKPAPTPRASVALDCAAFFARKQEA